MPDDPIAQALSRFATRLEECRLQAGNPSVRDLVRLSEQAGHGLARATINEKLTGRSAPDWEFVAAFVRACALHDGRLATVRLEPWRQVHQEFLRELAGTRRERRRAGRPNGTPVPAQLPADVAAFAGRAGPLAQLDGLLGASTVVISAVSGTAGVGKTALAVHWAHRVRDRFPDGQLYVNLRGFDASGQVLPPPDAIRVLLDALGVAPDRLPTGLDAQTALYRSLLAGRRLLIVLDNARDAEQVRPLLPGETGSLVLVTSRNRLTGLVATDGAHPLALDLLSEAEGHELLARRIGAQRLADEPAAARALVAACARLPLALAVLAARARQSGFPLAALAADLAEAGTRLDVLDGGDPTSRLRAVFAWSYLTLGEPAARLFRLLGLHPGPDVTVAAAASLAGLPRPAARRLLDELTAASLLAEPTPGRYAFHDLLRAYAAERAEQDPDEAAAAVRRLLDHLLHTAYAADRLVVPVREPLRVPLVEPAAGAEALPLPDLDHATAWLTAEHATLIAAVPFAAGRGLDAHAYQLTWSFDTFIDRQGHWHDLTASYRVALAAARRLGEPTAEAYAHRRLAHTTTRFGRTEEAYAHFEQALELLEGAGDLVAQAHTLLSVTIMREREGDLAAAIEAAQRAAELSERAGHRRGQADALNAIGWCHALLHDYDRALECCGRALRLQQELGDSLGVAYTWDSLGYAHHHQGHHAEAVECYSNSLTGFRELGDRYYEAVLLIHLGETHEAAGDLDQARLTWADSLEILTGLGHAEAAEVRERLDRLPAPR